MPAKSKKTSFARKPVRGSLPAVKFQVMTTGAGNQLFKVDSIGRKTRVASSRAPKATSAKPAAGKARAGKMRPVISNKPKARKATAEETVVLNSNPFKRAAIVQIMVRPPSRRK